MLHSEETRQKLLRRQQRTRASLGGNIELPRLSVHRSLRHIYAQLIDDQTGRTIAMASDMTSKEKATKTERARLVGTEIAKQAKSAKVTHVRFDRGGRRYHGRVAAVAEAAREAGLQF